MRHSQFSCYPNFFLSKQKYSLVTHDKQSRKKNNFPWQNWDEFVKSKHFPPTNNCSLSLSLWSEQFHSHFLWFVFHCIPYMIWGNQEIRHVLSFFFLQKLFSCDAYIIFRLVEDRKNSCLVNRFFDLCSHHGLLGCFTDQCSPWLSA